MARGDRTRVKGAEQERKNVVLYSGNIADAGLPPIIPPAGIPAKTSYALDFGTKVVDIKSTVTRPAGVFTFTSPRSRFYRFECKATFSVSVSAGTVAPAPYDRTVSFFFEPSICKNGARISNQQVLPASVVYYVSGPAWRVFPTVPVALAAATVTLFVNAGETITVKGTHTAIEPVLINGIEILHPDALLVTSTFEAIEITPEA
jgi:hypothetical protein